MSTQNTTTPDGQLDLSQFGDETASSRERIHWIRLEDAVQPVGDSDADFDREHTHTSSEERHTDSFEKCPLCVNKILDTPLHKHLPDCPVGDEVPR